MAGMIAEAFAAPDRDSNAQIVWFWFTPFAGLVEQAKGAIKSTFVGLRVRDLQGDRKTRGTSSGDVYVTTWASVAASNKDTRKVRTGGEFDLSLDNLIAELRADGFRIGVVVDEAHHSCCRRRQFDHSCRFLLTRVGGSTGRISIQNSLHRGWSPISGTLGQTGVGDNSHNE
jgi:hypothetical protein